MSFLTYCRSCLIFIISKCVAGYRRLIGHDDDLVFS